MPRATAILEFWFGSLDARGLLTDPGIERRWFTADEQLDNEIRARFEADLRNAAAGRLQRWVREPRRALALTILCDQFPRNMYRGTPRAFLFDERARHACEEALRLGHDAHLWPVEQMFLLMPLQHAEDLDCQNESARRLTALVDAAPPEQASTLEEALRFAEDHRRVVERFGRFPHRNEVLGRESTPDERAFLASGAASWGQTPSQNAAATPASDPESQD
ncbi:MAG: DUF924 family protein [Halofilum sp. (in: g-proteobacteria)]